MMGDPGTSDPKLLYPTLGVQEFHVQAPGFALEPSEPSFSNNLHDQHALFHPPLDHHPPVSCRPAGSEARSNRDFEGVSVGARNCAQDPIQNRSSDSEDPLDVMARARVGADDLFTFPKGEADSVTITASDLASLQSGKFLTDNIVDFYLKYLKRKASSPEQQNRFHFFNSFFFRKLLETTASTGVDEYKVDYLQLRKWVGDVHLFEKDFVFVPIIVSSHWSLLVICHLRSLNPSSPGEKKYSPCILHLDPIEGEHESFEGQVKSFVLQAWLKGFEASNNLDILHSLFQMKYVQAKVPQQDNGYDCGLYILHYIEVFLSKSSLQELIVSSFEGGAHFTRPNFRVEVLDKRNSIRRIVFQLGGMSAFYDGNHLSIQPMPQEEDGLVHFQGHQHERLLKVVKEMKSKKWKEMETSILLQCMASGGRFNKGKLGSMHWDLIAKEINTRNNGGPLRSKEQCQNRFDTLLKAYKDLNAYCLRVGKEFCQVSKLVKRSLKLATPLEHEEWYNHLCTICDRRSSIRDHSHKRQKPNVDGDMDVNKLASSPIHPSSQCPLPLDGIGHSKSTKPSSRQVVLQAFNGMKEALRYTFFNLIQIWSWKTKCLLYDYEEMLCLEYLCHMLGILQDQSPLEICHHVYQLQDLKLVTLSCIESNEDFFEDYWMNKIWVEASHPKVYKQFRRKVLNKNPHLDHCVGLSHSDVFTTQLYLLQQIRVLNLIDCWDLKTLDLENFPHLCCLYITYCKDLKVVNGWEVAKGLGWIEIRDCPSYSNHPDLQFLSSLKQFYITKCGGQSIPWQLANFNHCVQLQRLSIEDDNNLVESMDLKALRVLEVLSFSRCTSLSTIHGLSGLQSLMKLKVVGCKNLKVILDLGCLKALTHLDMSYSGIIEILGLEELHLLTSLCLSGCKSLESLPPLGHLKALAHLYLFDSCIEEIPGVEELVSLEALHCSGSKLKQLPNLDHLRRLRDIYVFDTPLSRMDPSRSFIGGYEVIQNDIDREGVFGDDISDTNDSGEISSSED